MAYSAAVERFLRYTGINTTSDPAGAGSPSSSRELVLAKMLVQELEELGVADAELSPYGIVTASIPASAGCEQCPAIGFIAHMDTSPEANGGPVKVGIVSAYDGGDILLNEAPRMVLSPAAFSCLSQYKGQDLIVTDGTTLLGADDKAGIAAIMEMVEHFCRYPNDPHARICVAFTPDEEIGRGVDHFNIERFGAAYAYTVDGGPLGELGLNTFNAAAASIVFHGVSVHPGEAKGRMKSAIKMAMAFMAMLPADEAPETTQDFEGFYHVVSIEGTVAQARVELIIRDHDAENFERRKALIRKWVASFGPSAELAMADQYGNMRPYLDKCPAVISLARVAYHDCAVSVTEPAVRGGTDGANLSARGLPCPNIFTGGENFHGPYEFLPIPSFEKAVEVVKRLAQLSASAKIA